MEKKITRENLAEHMFVYQLGIIDKRIMDVVDDDHWKFNLTLTALQKEEFKKYCITVIKKTLKCNTTKATENFEWFYKSFGLRIKN